MAPLKRRVSRRKPRGWESYVKAYARRVWGWSAERKQVRNRTEVANGRHRCEECLEVFPRSSTDVDHVVPVEKITGWDEDWNGWFKRLMVPAAEMRNLCKVCHSSKSVAENKLRAIARKAKKE